MITRSMVSIGFSVAVAAHAFVASACIAARNEDELGETHFVVSRFPSSADYEPAGHAGQSSGPIGAAATSGKSPAPLAQAGVASPLPLAGRGAAQAGTPAAIGGESGRATAAGASAAGSAGSALPPPTGAPMATAAAGSLTIDFSSVNQGGRYAPRNVGAVWIETSTGTFVKTLERWAGIRANHLTRWAMLSGGWGRFGGGGNTVDQMDAVSRATLRSHEKHHVTWDMQDATGKLVPDGKYKLVIEVTEDNFRAGAYSGVDFDKGSAPQLIMTPDKPPYAGLTLRYQP